MEGGDDSLPRTERMTLDQLPLMGHVVFLLAATWVVSNLGWRNWLLVIGIIAYVVWIHKHGWERDMRRILFEEKKKINSKKAMNEAETMRWMNECLKVMWPISMEKFASQHFFKPMAPWFLWRFKPAYVREVTLQHLYLGSTPPDFTFIRVLPRTSENGDDVIFEANMEFHSGKDMNAVMSVLMSGFPKINFYVSELYIKGTVKFAVKFLDRWPVIGHIRFSFANTPVVDMTARPSFKNGLDVRTFVPGAANWLEATLGTALDQSVVEPYMLVVDFEKLVSNMMFPDMRSRPGGKPEFFNVETKSGFQQAVVVEILEAGELKPPTAGAALPDPFVEVALGSHKKKTKPASKTLNPSWENEKQRIPIEDWELPNLLTLRVISKRSLKQRELGICSIKLNTDKYKDGQRHMMRLKLDNVPTGWIRVAITVECTRETQSPGTAEEPHATVGSQPTTRDITIPTTSPPQTAAAAAAAAAANIVTANPSVNHTRSSSTSDTSMITAPEEAASHSESGSTEFIKMPYGTDGAFTIQCPGEGETVHFPAPLPAPTNGRKHHPKSSEKAVAPESKEKDAKVKRSMKSILGFRKRNASKVSQEMIELPEREMTLSEHSGYTSSLDRSKDLKVYHGGVSMKLLSPEMLSREPPSDHIQPLKLESVLSEQPHAPTPEGHSTELVPHSTELVPHSTELVPHSTELVPHSSQLVDYSSELVRGPEPEKQNSKTPWWKKGWKKRRKSRGSSKPEPGAGAPEYEYYPSDTSATQSFRLEPRDLQALLLPHENSISTDNGSILAVGRSQSARQEPVTKRVVHNGAQSMRHNPTHPSFLNTIHERHQGLDHRPHH